MSASKMLIAALVAAVAILPITADAAKRSSREKSRTHKARSEKSGRHGASAKSKRRAAVTSQRGEFERRWDSEQIEPDLPQSE